MVGQKGYPFYVLRFFRLGIFRIFRFTYYVSVFPFLRIFPFSVFTYFSVLRFFPYFSVLRFFRFPGSGLTGVCFI